MIQLKINGIDRTDLIVPESLNWEAVLTSEVDSLSFSIRRHAGQTYKPSLVDDVQFFIEDEKVFGGIIIEVASKSEVAGLEMLEVQCKDYTHLADRKLVVKIYEDELLEDVLDDIVATFLPAGFTTDNVVVPALTVNYISFNYEQPSQCFQQLADLFGLDWYIDPEKDLHFFVREVAIAPFNLTDDNGKYFYNSLVLRENVRNLRNTIFVRGGEFKGTLFSEKEVAVGNNTRVFKQGFRYSEVYVKLNGADQTVGIENIDSPDNFDVLYNFQEKHITFPTALTDGDSVEVGGLPHIPVIIKLKENTSITEFGEFQHKLVDKSLNSKEGARDKAKGEVQQWAEEVNDGVFETLEHGLRVGQAINIQSTLRGVDKTYIIKRLTARMQTPTVVIYSAELLASETMTAIDFFNGLLTQKDKEIQINRDEVLDKIETVFEALLITEAFVVLTDHNRQLENLDLGENVVVQALNYPVEFVYAPFPTPDGFKREGRYNGAEYD